MHEVLSLSPSFYTTPVCYIKVKYQMRLDIFSCLHSFPHDNAMSLLIPFSREC